MSCSICRPPAPAARPRLRVEGMEDRSVPALLASPRGGGGRQRVHREQQPGTRAEAVLGFHRNRSTAAAQFGTFATGGTGQLNIPKLVGPDDGDQQVRATADGRFLSR